MPATRRIPPPLINEEDPLLATSATGQSQQSIWINNRLKILEKWWQKRQSYFVLASIVIAYSLLVSIGPLILALQKRSNWCPYPKADYSAYGNYIAALEKAEDDNDDGSRYYSRQQRELKSSGDPPSNIHRGASPYENPDYNLDPCLYLRLPELFFLTLEECDISRRMLFAVIIGGIIGFERRAADRPAGIRTMGLVSLGACFFTISSIMGFRSSTMDWDSSRVTAALPSGVGFLGGALIWKGMVFVGPNRQQQQVHGLTTAASLWLSAALGVAAGGALYAVTCYATVLVLIVLRFGPRLYLQKDGDNDDDDDDEDEDNDDQREQESQVPSFAGRFQPLQSLPEASVVNVGRRFHTDRPTRKRDTYPTFGS